MIGKSCISDFVFDQLADAISSHQTFLEIGTYDGGTISKLAEKYPEKEFTCVDDFSEGHFDLFNENTRHLKNISCVKGDSTKVLERFIQEKRIYDTIFIDGNHEYEYVIKDLLNSLKICSYRVYLHDRKYPGVAKAILEAVKQKNLVFHIVDDFLTWCEI